MLETDFRSVFESWVRQHGGLLLRVARTYTATEEDREDLVQDMLVQLWGSLPRFEGRARESTWIYRVALNTALAWRRADSRRRQRFQPALALEAIAVDAPDHAQGLANEEVLARLYDAIRSLPKVDAALVMLHLDGLSYREIAEVLGISETNVGVKLTRARRTLAEWMKEVVCES